MPSDAQRQLLTLCAIRAEGASVDWNLIARNAQTAEDLALLAHGMIRERSAVASESLPILTVGLADLTSAAARVETELAAAARVGARLTTVLDADYPTNLRLVPNLPPFLFYRGELRADDALSVAVVGTRTASLAGLDRAGRLARQLVDRGVTVTSGLARGIDTAAHTAALKASGRTVAVVGTGITGCYPAENRDLAEAIVDHGALVSQFWPSAGPARWTFPRRNVVMSGITQGTAVIEASGTSGAKMQARIAAEHGKQVFLLASLVAGQEWARRMVGRGQATLVETVDDVLDRLAPAERIHRAGAQRQQLALDVL
jgi:DNA processing protein